jgi:hypothetical protein
LTLPSPAVGGSMTGGGALDPLLGQPLSKGTRIAVIRM